MQEYYSREWRKEGTRDRRDRERYREDKELLSTCLAALASLAVRNEYCQQVVDIGGLRHIQDLLVGHTDQAELVRGCLILTKVLAGNDRVKEEVGKTGGIPLILSAFIKHIDRSESS